jgi:hypothetical protein
LNGNACIGVVFRQEIQEDAIEKIRVSDNAFSIEELEYNAFNTYQ